MENENKTTINDEHFLAYYVIRAIDTDKNKTSGIICQYNKYAAALMFNKEKIDSTGVYLSENGEIIVHPKLTSIKVVAECSSSQIDQFNTKLHEYNLCIKVYNSTFKPLFGNKRVTLANKLFIANPALVKYNVHGKLLDLKQFSDYELAEGESCHYYFDNGYSYMSIEPISKDKYMETINKRLAEPYYYATDKGTTIKQDKNNPKTWVAETYIQKATNYSEISNS